MSNITRRSLIVSGAGLAVGAFVPPAEAATGSIALHIASSGFIFAQKRQEFDHRLIDEVGVGAVPARMFCGCEPLPHVGAEVLDRHAALRFEHDLE